MGIDSFVFANGKYVVSNDNGKLTATRNGEKWDRDLTGDNLIYWMLVKAIEQQEEIESLKDELDEYTKLYGHLY